MTTPAAYRPSTPHPPLTGLPVEREAEREDWPLQPPAQVVDEMVRGNETRGSQLDVQPVPIIGAINFGGTVSDAGRVTLAAGASVTVGESGGARPRTTMIGLYSDGTFGSAVELLARSDQIGGGCALPLGEGGGGLLWLPLKRATLRNSSASTVTLSYLVVGYET